MKAYSQMFVSMKQVARSLPSIDFFSGQGAKAFHSHRMRKQFINEVHSRPAFFDQQYHAHTIREVSEILAEDLDDSVFDCGIEL